MCGTCCYCAGSLLQTLQCALGMLVPQLASARLLTAASQAVAACAAGCTTTLQVVGSTVAGIVTVVRDLHTLQHLEQQQLLPCTAVSVEEIQLCLRGCCLFLRVWQCASPFVICGVWAIPEEGMPWKHQNKHCRNSIHSFVACLCIWPRYLLHCNTGLC